MELKQGYKHTEVGIIPEDWEVKFLDELADVIDPHPSHRAPIAVSNGIPFLGIGDFNEKGEIIKETFRVVPSIIYEEHQKRYNLNDELLGLGRVASIGKVIKFRNDLGNFTISPTMGVLKPTNSTRNYLFQILKSQYVTQYFTKIMSGSTRSSVGMMVLRKIPIPIPKILAEQTAIATALSDTDALIASLEKLIVKKQAIKQGAMQELLKPKEGWVVKKLGEVATVFTGKKNNQDKIEEGIFPFFVRSQIVEKINNYSYECEGILIPGEGNIGKIIHYINGKFEVHQRVYLISNFQGVVGKFLYWFLLANFGNHAIKNTVKATVDSLRLSTFIEFELLLPRTLKDQIEIAKILDDMEAEITTLQTKLQKLKQLKQAQMQVLLTGKIRLV